MPQDELKAWRTIAATHNFARKIDGAETHWYFIEGALAFQEKLYIAASLCFINGIEASIRTLLMYLNESQIPEQLSGATLSNPLLLKAKKAGMNVEVLAFPMESEFLKKIETKDHVELVRTRHNICHGNLFEYFQKNTATEEIIFTPECMIQISTILKNISENWAKEIFRFKQEFQQA